MASINLEDEVWGAVVEVDGVGVLCRVELHDGEVEVEDDM